MSVNNFGALGVYYLGKFAAFGGVMSLRPFGLLAAAAVMTLAQVSTAPPAATPNAEKPKEKSRIEGRVTSLATGEPLRKATLRLRGAMMPATSNPADVPSFTSTTDNEGKFVFEDIEAGR